MSPIYIFFALFSLNFFFEKNGNDKTSVGLFCFLNFLLSFFIPNELVKKIVKVTFFLLKNGTIFGIFFNFLLKYLCGF